MKQDKAQEKSVLKLMKKGIGSSKDCFPTRTEKLFAIGSHPLFFKEFDKYVKVNLLKQNLQDFLKQSSRKIAKLEQHLENSLACVIGKYTGSKTRSYEKMTEVYEEFEWFTKRRDR